MEFNFLLNLSRFSLMYLFFIEKVFSSLDDYNMDFNIDSFIDKNIYAEKSAGVLDDACDYDLMLKMINNTESPKIEIPLDESGTIDSHVSDIEMRRGNIPGHLISNRDKINISKYKDEITHFQYNPIVEKNRFLTISSKVKLSSLEKGVIYNVVTDKCNDQRNENLESFDCSAGDLTIPSYSNYDLRYTESNISPECVQPHINNNYSTQANLNQNYNLISNDFYKDDNLISNDFYEEDNLRSNDLSKNTIFLHQDNNLRSEDILEGYNGDCTEMDISSSTSRTSSNTVGNSASLNFCANDLKTMLNTETMTHINGVKHKENLIISSTSPLCIRYFPNNFLCIECLDSATNCCGKDSDIENFKNYMVLWEKYRFCAWLKNINKPKYKLKKVEDMNASKMDILKMLFNEIQEIQSQLHPIKDLLESPTHLLEYTDDIFNVAISKTRSKSGTFYYYKKIFKDLQFAEIDSTDLLQLSSKYIKMVPDPVESIIMYYFLFYISFINKEDNYKYLMKFLLFLKKDSHFPKLSIDNLKLLLSLIGYKFIVIEKMVSIEFKGKNIKDWFIEYRKTRSINAGSEILSLISLFIFLEDFSFGRTFANQCNNIIRADAYKIQGLFTLSTHILQCVMKILEDSNLLQ